MQFIKALSTIFAAIMLTTSANAASHGGVPIPSYVPIDANGIPASFYVDFTTGNTWPAGQSYGSIATVSRALEEWAQNSDGTMTSAGVNTLAVGTGAGLQCPVARTNEALWSRDMTQAGSWTASNTTVALSQTGVDGAANSANLVTATASNGTLTQAVAFASFSQPRRYAASIKRVSGTGEIDITLNGATWVPVDSLLNSSTFTRVGTGLSILHPIIGVRVVTSGDAIVVDMNMEAIGTWDTPPVVTTTATVTRPADIISTTGLLQAALAATTGSLQVNLASGPGPTDLGYSPAIVWGPTPTFSYLGEASGLFYPFGASVVGATIGSAASTQLVGYLGNGIGFQGDWGLAIGDSVSVAASWAPHLLNVAGNGGPAGSSANVGSVTTNTVGTGALTFTVAQGLGYSGGQNVVIITNVPATDPATLIGTVTSYSTSTGALVVNIASVTGTGTGSYSAWLISSISTTPAATQFLCGASTANVIGRNVKSIATWSYNQSMATLQADTAVANPVALDSIATATTTYAAGTHANIPAIGVNVHAQTQIAPKKFVPDATNVAMAKQVRADRVRSDDGTQWEVIEQVKGSYNFNNTGSSLIPAMDAAGIPVDLVFDYGNHLYTGGFFNLPKFRQFANVSISLASPAVITVTPSWTTTSTTSNVIGISAAGTTKTFTVDPGLSASVGDDVIAFNGANQMTGIVLSYSGTTLVMRSNKISGSGTFTSWTVSNWHGLLASEQLAFTTTGALPTGLVVGTPYYVRSSGLTPYTFTVTPNLSGTGQINTSGSQSGVQTVTQDGITGGVAFCTVAALHWGVRNYSIQNEVNLGWDTNNGYDPIQYASYEKQCAAAINGVAPGSTIQFGALSPGPGYPGGQVDQGTRFLTDALTTADLSGTSVFSIHPYPGGGGGTRNITANPEHIVSDTAGYVATSGAKPWWIGEFGYFFNQINNFNQPTGTRKIWASYYVARTLLSAVVVGARSGIGEFLWYDLIDDGPNQDIVQAGFGLFDNNYNPQPPSIAFTTMKTLFDQTTAFNIQTAGQWNAYWGTFTTGTGACFVAWSAYRDFTFTYHAPAFSTLTVQDVLGNPMAFTRVGQALTYTLPGNGSPILACTQ